VNGRCTLISPTGESQGIFFLPLVQKGRSQKPEARRQKAEGRSQKPEDRRQKAEGRRQKAEGRSQKDELVMASLLA
jgi:hypothetical protein